VQLVQTHRLLLAKHLLSETQLPIIEVAFAAGFQSVRRFNALFSSRYRLAPSRFRRAAAPSLPLDVLRLHVAYRPPLAWRELLEFIAPRAITGIERVDGGTYLRTANIDGHQGWIKVALGAKPNTLAVEFAAPLVPVLGPLLARVRRLFDLGARPDAIADHLARDRRIGAAVRRCPGVRVPGAFDGFELAWRAILGQLVSVRAAGTLAARLALQFGATIETPDPLLNRLSPSAERLAEAAPKQLVSLGIARPRGVAIVALARAVADGRLRLEPGADPQSTIEQLESLPGIGEWTAQYIAMRALSWPDAFPAGDLGLRRGLKEPSKARLQSIAEAWRPWRAYAAMHVWRQ
jgi:AraC family transcriptional regulator of adaptative response / DNA-3-methyladenine glycosylase II